MSCIDNLISVTTLSSY